MFSPGMFESFGDDVSDLAYLFTDQTFCKLKSITTPYKDVSVATVTFAPPSLALQCHFKN